MSGDIAMTDLAGTSVLELAAANPSDIVTELQTAARRIPLWPFLAVAFVALAGAVPPVGLPLLIVGAPLTWWVGQRDTARRRVVVFYDVEGESADRFASLIDAHTALSNVQRAWNHEANAALRTQYQRKVNAGASSLVRRSQATLSTKGPKVLVTNIEVPTLDSRRRSVYFLPDRVLVREGRRYADIPYDSLQVNASPSRFIEDGPVPGDSERVGTTWRYVRVDGGPDRRFNNNSQLPIMLYGNVTLQNAQGFLMVWEFSQPPRALAFADWLSQVATRVGPRGVILPDSPREQVPPAMPAPGRAAAPAPHRPAMPTSDPIPAPALAPGLVPAPVPFPVSAAGPATSPATPDAPVPRAPVPAEEPTSPRSLHHVRWMLYVLSGLLVAAAVLLAYLISRTATNAPPADHPPSFASDAVAYVVFSALFAGAVLFLARSTRRGRNWARITLVVSLLLCSLSCGISGLAGPASVLGQADMALTINGVAFGVCAFASTALAVFSAMLLLQSPVNAYIRAATAWRRAAS